MAYLNKCVTIFPFQESKILLKCHTSLHIDGKFKVLVKYVPLPHS